MAKVAVMVSWEDSPHLTEEQKQTILAGIPPWQRGARSRGIPQLGSGAIYQVEEADLVIQPYPLPSHFPRCFAMDVGWNRTAALWIAKNPDTQQLVVYADYYKGQAEPSIHAHGILAHGRWIPGVIDPAARGRSQKDGEKLFDIYTDLGLDVEPANNAREAGIYAVWELMSMGQLKIFSTCASTISEYRLYRRDEKGNIVKTNDHLMDCLRYGVMSGIERMKVEPAARPDGKQWFSWSPQPFWSG